MNNETVTQDYYSDETVKFGDHLAAACDLVLPAQKKLVQCLGVKFRTLSNEEEDLSETRANWFSILSGIVWACIWQLLNPKGQRLFVPYKNASIAEEAPAMFTKYCAIWTRMKHLTERFVLREKHSRIMVIK